MKMFGCTEDIGEYTRLDWGDEPPETTMADRRGETGRFAADLFWKDLMQDRLAVLV